MLRRLALAVLAVMLAFAGSACEDRRTPVQQAVEWFPASQRSTARCIVFLESGDNPRAVGRAGEAGLFQIHPVHRRDFERLTGRPWSAAWDPVLNGQMALAVWRESGWRAWSTARRCSAGYARV